MSLKKIIALLSIFVCFNVYGALSDFAEDVEDSGKSSSSSSNSSSSNDYGDDFADVLGDDACAEEIFSDCLTGWAEYNSAIRYYSYPYEDPKNPLFYFDHNKISKSSKLHEDKSLIESESDNEYVLKSEKPFLFNVYSSAGYYCDNGWGADINVKIMLVHIGLFGNYEYLQDEYEDNLSYLNGGLSLILAQFSNFYADLYGGFLSLDGVLTLSGGNFGMNIILFPIKPIRVKFSLGQQILKNTEYSVEFIDADFNIGFMINRFEFYGGYRLRKTEKAQLHKIYVGAGIYF